MDTNCKNIELTDYAVKLIAVKAQQLVGKAGYTQSDYEDIEHDLALDLLRRLHHFDAGKACYNTFIARVVERKISDLLRHRHRQIRDHRREDYSLNDYVEVATDDLGEVDFTQRAETISQDECDIRMGKYQMPAEDRAHMRIDIDMVLAELPPDLRQAAEMLQSHSVSHVARAMGIPRRTFRDKYLAQLQEVFTAKGLVHYFSQFSRQFTSGRGK